ncbi:hypothetical protein THIOKS13320046 [Thiocapsa sp. KS1]|nr:hypothetical protein THIOKS13320046 [Thiocapsa sp. KS1]
MPAFFMRHTTQHPTLSVNPTPLTDAPLLYGIVV